MAESCSHVASVLFYIEAWTRILGKLSCTQVKCTWLLPSYVKEVPYARVRDINFSSARKLKADLDAKIDSIGERREVCVASHGSNLRTIKVHTLSEMNKGKVKPVALSLIEPYSDQFVLKSRQILTISGLFDLENMSLSYPDLLKKCFNLKITLSSEEISQIEKDTQNQAKGSGFFTHRAGRISASLSGAVCHTNPAQPSQSLIKSICYPHLFTINTKAVTYGCKHEDDAIKAYEEIMAMTHTDFKNFQVWISYKPGVSLDSCNSGLLGVMFMLWTGMWGD